jgi:hypothetical protein
VGPQGSVAYGGPWLLDQLWQRLGIGAILAARLKTTRRDASAERVLFALVATGCWTPCPSSRRARRLLDSVISAGQSVTAGGL